MALDIAAIRREFSMLSRKVGGKPIHYLDSANTSHKPECVIDAMSSFMRESYSPIGRSSYSLASEASDLYETARSKVANFINASAAHEVVFTKNATESLNLAAQSWGRAH
ncbi:MAG: aminotransferase class V-fold PLP-dependent enzyme, partial [Actinobacteria bacterium]|nr:aminotransferase class V-fold PLP-dependent enzyme [Actinomycetota bacterium]